MATAKSSKRKTKTVQKRSRKAPGKRALSAAGNHNKGTETSLYLYGIAPLRHRFEPVHQQGVDGKSRVEPLLCGGFTCWISRVSRPGFADKISANMDNLDWLASASVRHQRVVSELGRRGPVLPARFGTVFHTQEPLEQDLAARKRVLQKSLQHVTDADEWGIKVFLEPPAQPSPVREAASSGSDYLRRKATALHNEMQQRSRPRSLSVEIQKLAVALDQIALETAPAGKLSSNQPGLEWQISILLPRGRQQQFSSMMENFSRQWRPERRIEFTGPWPPYSFVKV